MNLEINLNAKVRAKLTLIGRKVWQDWIDEAWTGMQPPEWIKKPKSTDVFEGSLWECARIFGPHMSVGVEPPMETEIEILTDWKLTQ